MRIGPIQVMRGSGYDAIHREIERLCRELDAMRIERDKLHQQLYPLQAIEIQRLAGEGREYREPPTPPPSPLAMFHVLDGWTTRFDIEGTAVGGPADLCHDPRLAWFSEAIGGVLGNRILELGPLEGAHTSALLRAGAREVIAIEGFRPAWLRCLVIKEILRLDGARFLYGDFCAYAASYTGPPFDAVLAAGVLYHQTNPAELIRDLGRLTGQLLGWTQVADERFPPDAAETEVIVGDRRYRGRLHDYGARRDTLRNYCGGVGPKAVWLYADELRRALSDAGLTQILERPPELGPYGPSLTFVARREAPTSTGG